jgi:hypothetical protein
MSLLCPWRTTFCERCRPTFQRFAGMGFDRDFVALPASDNVSTFRGDRGQTATITTTDTPATGPAQLPPAVAVPKTVTATLRSVVRAKENEARQCIREHLQAVEGLRWLGLTSGELA